MTAYQTNWPLRMGGKKYEAGAIVELTDEIAAPLLANKTISPTASDGPGADGESAGGKAPSSPQAGGGSEDRTPDNAAASLSSDGEDAGSASSSLPADIYQAIEKALADGDATGSGKPLASALEAILGRAVTAAQRDQWHEAYMAMED